MKNRWHWKNVKMSSCCTCTIVSKVSTNCQPGVRFVIISRWKNMRVIFPVFVCICVCICNFLDGGTRSKKKYFMKFYEFVNFMNFMKFFEKWGRGGTKIWSLDNWQSFLIHITWNRRTKEGKHMVGTSKEAGLMKGGVTDIWIWMGCQTGSARTQDESSTSTYMKHSSMMKKSTTCIMFVGLNARTWTKQRV